MGLWLTNEGFSQSVLLFVWVTAAVIIAVYTLRSWLLGWSAKNRPMGIIIAAIVCGAIGALGWNAYVNRYAKKEVANDSPEIALSMDCRQVMLPLTLPGAQTVLQVMEGFPQIYGGLMEFHFAPTPNEKKWPTDNARGFVWRCDLRNFGTLPLFNIELPTQFDFLRMVDGTARDNDVEVSRPRGISIPQLPDGSPFTFYIRNTSDNVLNVKLYPRAIVQLVANSERREVAVLLPKTAEGPLRFGPRLPDLEPQQAKPQANDLLEKRKRIEQWRSMVRTIDRQTKQEKNRDRTVASLLEANLDFLALKPHLSQRTLSSIYGNIVVVPPPNSTMFGVLHLLLKDVDELERKWGLA